MSEFASCLKRDALELFKVLSPTTQNSLSLLLESAEAGATKICLYLIRTCGVDPNKMLPSGRTPLIQLCHSQKKYSLDGMKILISLGANPSMKSSTGEHPLEAALHARDPEKWLLLIEKGSRPDSEAEAKKLATQASSMGLPHLAKIFVGMSFDILLEKARPRT